MVCILGTSQRLAYSQSRTFRDAVRDGTAAEVKNFLDAGSSADGVFENGLTPIYFASDPQVVDLLLSTYNLNRQRNAARTITP